MIECIDYKAYPDNKVGVLARDGSKHIYDYSPRVFPATFHEMEFAIVNNLVINYKGVSILYFDIETEDIRGAPIIGKDRVVSMAAIDSDGNKFFLCEDDERILLKKIKELMLKYRINIGWNSSKYDTPVLLERGRIEHVDFEKVARYHLDLKRFVSILYTVKRKLSSAVLRDHTLNSYGEVFLNLPKIEMEYGGNIANLFKTDRESLKTYNLRDVEIVKGLDELFKITETFIAISEVIGVPIYNIKSSLNAAHEMLILKEIADTPNMRELLAEFMKNQGSIAGEYRGAFNYLKAPGLYHNLVIFDFVSMYQSMLRTFNISFETESKEGILIDDIQFQLEPRSILARISDKLARLRAEFKAKGIDTFEIGVKLIGNSMYGYFGSDGARFPNVNVARAVTWMARHIMEYFITQLGELAVYADTDSLFIVCKLDAVPEMQKILDGLLEKFFHEKYPQVLKRSVVKLKFECHFEKIFFQSGKRFIGWMDYPRKELHFRGVELSRGDFNIFVKNTLSEFLKMVYDERSLTEFKRFLLKKKRELFDFSIDVEDLTFTQMIRKPLNEYKDKPLHVRIIEREVGRCFVGQEVSYIITGENKKKEEGVSLAKAKRKNIKYSPEIYWIRRILPVFQRFLSILYPYDNLSDIRRGWSISNQVRLEEYSLGSTHTQLKVRKR